MSSRGADALRVWLKEERRTQEWLSEQIGVHQTSVSAWFQGRRISLKDAVLVEKLTGIPIADWLEAESGTSLSDDDTKAAG